MQNVRNCFIFCLLLAASISHSQDRSIIRDYIATYKNIAIAEMQRTGVPASIKLAQGIHETMAGTSDLVTRSNNHFGIKCKSNWTGESVSHDDDARGECFRKYKDPADSYTDHSNFLKNGPRYAFLFKLDPLDYSGWAYGLKKAGYATNPKYPLIIIKLIKDYDLQDYTLIAMGKKADPDEMLAKNDDTEKPVIPMEQVMTSDEKIGSLPGTPIAAKPATIPVNYPSGEFRINDTKVIFATRGTSFLTIARQYDVSLARLFEFNELTESESLAQDQLVFLQRKRKSGANEYHVVKPGESLYDISQEEGIRLESLLGYNQLSKEMLPAEGQRLHLRSKAATRPLLASAQNDAPYNLFAKNERKDEGSAAEFASSRVILYTVRPKETIYSISKKNNVKIEDLVEWNQLSSYTLKAGQQLKIYK